MIDKARFWKLSLCNEQTTQNWSGNRGSDWFCFNRNSRRVQQLHAWITLSPSQENWPALALMAGVPSQVKPHLLPQFLPRRRWWLPRDGGYGTGVFNGLCSLSTWPLSHGRLRRLSSTFSLAALRVRVTPHFFECLHTNFLMYSIAPWPLGVEENGRGTRQTSLLAVYGPVKGSGSHQDRGHHRLLREQLPVKTSLRGMSGKQKPSVSKHHWTKTVHRSHAHWGIRSGLG